MAIKVRIPTPLRKLTKEQDVVQASGDTLAEMIETLEQEYPGMKDRLCDETGELRRFVNVYVNDEDIRYLAKENTPTKDGDTISIIPSIAGGCIYRRRFGPRNGPG